MQTKKQSIIETITSTAVGFMVSFLSTYIIFPLVGLQTTTGINLVVTIYFTAISLLRGYFIRRYFNKRKPATLK